MLTTDLCAQCGSAAATASLPGSACRCVLRDAAVAKADPPLSPPPPPAGEVLPTWFAGAPVLERPSAVEPSRGWSVRAGRDTPRLDWDVLQPPDPPLPGGATIAAGYPPVKPARKLALRAGVIAAALLLAGVAAVDGVAGGGLSSLFGSGRSLSQPSSIGSMGLVDAPDAQVAASAVRAGLSADAKHTVVGVYGSTGAAQLIFVAAKGGTPESSQQIVGDLSNAGLGFEGSGTIIPALDGQQFECGVISGQAFGAATLCAWNENDIDAVVLNLGSSDLQATATLAAQARAAAVH